MGRLTKADLKHCNVTISQTELGITKLGKIRNPVTGKDEVWEVHDTNPIKRGDLAHLPPNWTRKQKKEHLKKLTKEAKRAKRPTA